MNIRYSVGTLSFMVLLPWSVWGKVDIADKPLVLPSPLAPNIVVTIGDYFQSSLGEMNDEKWSEHFPGFYSADHLRPGNTRRWKSAHFNKIYYNPNITYEPPIDADGKALTTSFNKAWRNGFDHSRGSVDLSKDYRPIFSYDPTNDCSYSFEYSGWSVNFCFYVDHPKQDFKDVKKPTAAYYYVFDNNLKDCNGSKDDDDCYRKIDVSENEEQNFANWYSFYRTRNLMIKTTASHAFATLDSNVRLAWQSTDFCTLPGTSDIHVCSDGYGNTYNNLIRRFTGDHRANFYKWLFRLRTNGISSINRSLWRAGEYFKTGDLNSPNSPYAFDPQVSAGPVYTCRPNFHIIITDTLRHEGVGGPHDYGNVDGNSLTLPDGKTYTPMAPYKDSNHYPTAPDVAFYYWANDLRPDLEDNVLPYMPDRSGKTDEQYWNPKNDPATWQHLVNFTIGIGASKWLGNDWTGDQYGGPFYKGLFTTGIGSSKWPSFHIADSNLADAYDLWHIALNSRGHFFVAEDAEELADALEKTLNNIMERQSSAAALAISSTRLSTETEIYQARFDSKDWSGQLRAMSLNSDGSIGIGKWNVESKIPAAASRNILTWNGSEGKPFTWDGLSNEQKSAVKSTISTVFKVSADDALAKDVLDYLRGDQTKEQKFDTNGKLTGGTYRKRSSLLGDIVNSDPAFVADQDFGYAALPEGLDTASKPYKSYIAANKDRVKMLYVGANDGMLHGFIAGAGKGTEHACGGSGTEKLGQELFAYIPGSLVPELPKLSDPAYQHRYYVDGAPYVGDAYLPDLSADEPWRTILLGTTGAGGRVIFALDVTNPCEVNHTKVLWERNETWDADIGYTMSKPIIARLNNGKWAAVFGNGYNSGSGKAVLFVVDLVTGELIQKFDVGGSDNGLAAPSLYDADGNGSTDFIYAGDLLGRLWKFDLSAADNTKWAVAYSGSPLFTARYAGDKVQPITAAVELGAPPAGVNGVMVYFGTGRFFAEDDKIDKAVQSLYGILDNGTAIDKTDRSTLQAQEILTEENAGGRMVRTVSANAISYTDKRGWYLDLLSPPLSPSLSPSGTPQGERVVSIPRRQFQRVFYTTMIPSRDPCKFGGDSWVMELRPDSGGTTEKSIFDLDLGLKTPIAGIMTTKGITKSFEFLHEGAKGVMVNSGNTGEMESTKISLPVTATGRISWREIID